jgi:CelD/BcsL family acetyltransferase involved in cellulose biosynthesis/RimJ/RimL family protein N-acetyltransferase
MPATARRAAPATQLSVSELTRFEELAELEAEWQPLWRRSATADIFGSFGWLRAWWSIYGPECTLRALVVFDGEQPIGLLPLVLRANRWRFLGAPERDYCDVLCMPGREREVVPELLAAAAALARPGERCVLEDIPETSLIARGLPWLPRALAARLQFRPSCPCPTTVLHGRHAHAVDGILRKSSLRRHRNKLARLGRVSFRHLCDRAEIERHLPNFYRMHRARRALAGGRSSFDRAEARAFCEALVRELNPATELRFGVLMLDSRPIAYHFGLESAGRLIWYKPAFDVAFWNCSPGEVMIGHLFEYAAERRLSEVDLSRGAESFKQRFATDVRQNYTLELYPRGVRGWVRQRSHVLKERLKRNHARAFAALKSVQSWIRRSADRLHTELQRGNLLARSSRLVKTAARHVLFRRDEVLVFVDGNQTSLAPDPNPRADVAVYQGSLADLAEAAAEHPDYLDPARLARAARRLQSGDRVYVGRCEGQVAHVHWAGPRSELVTAEAGPGLTIPIDPPAIVAYDAWTAPRFRGLGLHTAVMRTVLADSRASGRRQWCYCTADNLASRRAIEKNGFRCVHRLVRMRVLGWTRQRVHHAAATTE